MLLITSSNRQLPLTVCRFSKVLDSLCDGEEGQLHVGSRLCAGLHERDAVLLGGGTHVRRESTAAAVAAATSEASNFYLGQLLPVLIPDHPLRSHVGL